MAAHRIAWAKFTNAGQTCVAPDYVVGTRPVLDALTPLLADAIEEFFGADPATSPDYGRMVSDRHFERMSSLVEPGHVRVGGASDAATRYIAPTVLGDVSPDSPVMQDEIFGPVLPMVVVSGLDAAIELINARDKPLALYVFSENPDTRRRFERDTASGGLGVNVALAHLTVPGLPFGDVGPSGMGAYHGRTSLETFTHAKAVLSQPTRVDSTALIYPPFRGLKAKLVDTMFVPRRRS